jgi:hypothetical protein
MYRMQVRGMPLGTDRVRGAGSVILRTVSRKYD